MRISDRNPDRSGKSSRRKMVRYLGASTRRRFSADRRAGEFSVRAGAWLAVIALVTIAVALLGVWQESQGNQAKKEGNRQLESVPLE